jgi:hypothetical protein
MRRVGIEPTIILYERVKTVSALDRAAIAIGFKIYFYFQRLFQQIQIPGLLFKFCNHFSQKAGLLGRVISPSQGRYLNTALHKHRINAYQTSKFLVGFESTISASERASQAVHALDGAGTASGIQYITS